MTGLAFLAGGYRALAATLLVLAVAVRLAVPAGYMLAEDTSGHIQIELCTEHGTVSRTLDLATGEYVDPAGKQPADDGQNGPEHCVFSAGAQMAAPLNTAPGLPQMQVIRAVSIHNPVSLETARRLAAPPPFPTGPPLTL